MYFQKIILFLILLFSTMPVMAFSFYVDASYLYHNVDVGGTELNPQSMRLKLGIPLSKNVAFEATYASGFEDDNVNALSLEIDSIVAAYFRFHSSMQGRGTLIYLLAGQANTSISTDYNGISGKEDFEDFSWAVGAEEESRAIDNFYYTFEYTRYYDDDDMNLTGISLGVKYFFR